MLVYRGVVDSLRRVAHAAFECFGLEVHRRTGDPLRFLAAHHIKTVLDIGANQGQFAQRARRLFPDAMIYSFEPIPRIFRELVKLRSRDSRFETINCALGERSGEIDFEENEFSGSSSVLPLTEKALQAFPFTSKTKKIRVAVQRLDDWAETRKLDAPMLVKLDVQGFEDRVIAGGIRTIKDSAVVISEVTFSPMYEGQVLFDRIYRDLTGSGFRLAGIIENTCDSITGKIWQGDAIFCTADLESELTGALRFGVVNEVT